MLTEFFFVRHGETDANLAGILQGNQNHSLNEVGIRQAKAVAEYLRDVDFSAIYSSDLLRAAKTAEIIAECGHADVPLVFTERLREWNCGEIEGWNWAKIREKYPVEAKSFYVEQLQVQMPDGESGMEFQKRISDFLDDLVVKHPGGRILLVAHGGVLQRMFRHVAGIVADGNLIPLAGNASVSSFVFNHNVDGWQLTSWNVREHLKDIPQHLSRVL